jgi:hypothetical protein
MTTVIEKINEDARGPLAYVIGKHGTGYADLTTHLSDLLVNTMHAIEGVLQATGEDDTGTDLRRLTLREVEVAVSHYLAEAEAGRVEPDADADILGGYHNPNVRIAQADDDEPLY